MCFRENVCQIKISDPSSGSSSVVRESSDQTPGPRRSARISSRLIERRLSSTLPIPPPILSNAVSNPSGRGELLTFSLNNKFTHVCTVQVSSDHKTHVFRLMTMLSALSLTDCRTLLPSVRRLDSNWTTWCISHCLLPAFSSGIGSSFHHQSSFFLQLRLDGGKHGIE